MTSIPGSVLQEAGTPGGRWGFLGALGRSLGGWRSVLLGILAVAAAGTLLGVLWWLLAPTAVATVQGNQVLLEGHQELQVAQDGWFAVVLGTAGVLLGTLIALRPSRRPAVQAVVGAVALAVAATVAWRVGTWLGPSALVEQVRAGSRTPVTPLVLRTPAPLLLLGPLLFSLTRFVAALLIGDQGAAAPGR